MCEDPLGSSVHLPLGDGEDPISDGEPANGLMDEIRSQSHDVLSHVGTVRPHPFE